MARKRIYYLGIALAALAVGACAITNQSLWIDEGSAAMKAMEPTLTAWWHNLRAEGNSNLQLVTELFYLWVWAKIFGASEIALRASNIPLFAGGMVALAWGWAARPRWQSALVVIALANAFLWYYLSEARPYIFLFAFSSATFAALCRSLSDDDARAAFRLLCLGAVGLCATSLIAVPWALAALLAFVYGQGTRSSLRIISRAPMAAAFLTLGLIAFGCYYLWTLHVGARASAVGQTTWATFAYSIYELAGLAGLGPGRLALRAEGARAMAAYLPAVGAGIIASAICLIAGAIALRRVATRKHFVYFSIAVVLPLILVLAAGAFTHTRLLGRHLTPLLPFVLAPIAIGVAELGSSKILAARIAAICVVFVFIGSALSIRFAPRHQRDDYRDAVAFARAALARHESVWWNADIPTARYYGLPANSPRLRISAAASDTQPDVVILSKPDIYDSDGAVRKFLADAKFTGTRTLPAFQIFQRPDSNTALAPR
ncbi:MAG: hypothetical protein M3R59_11095 [Verrucomicrobiota bacterium]|nr:hypothetical protein [Verrucomicrobiota bacterium]